MGDRKEGAFEKVQQEENQELTTKSCCRAAVSYKDNLIRKRVTIPLIYTICTFVLGSVKENFIVRLFISLYNYLIIDFRMN